MGNARCIPADRKAIFLPSQSRWINDKSRLKLAEKARQIGWTWATAYACVRRTALKSARFDQWVSSRDEMQARLFIEDCKLWTSVLEIAAADMGEVVIDPETRQTAYALRFANELRINSMSSNPDAQAGKRGGRVLDEFALHPDPRKLWAIAYPGITWGGNLEVFSTHRGSHNFFNQLIREVREGGNPKGISLHRVTLEDALNEGLLWKLQAKLPEDDERQEMDEQQYFDFVRSGCVDEESFQQEYMCKPADDDVAFLEYDLIASCEYSQAEWALNEQLTVEDLRGRELYAGVDIGRKRDLTVLWIFERLGDVLYTRKVIPMERMRKSDQEAIIWPWIAICQRSCWDATGLGIGWSDDAQDRFGESRVEAVTFTPRVKEELAYPVRGSMQDRTMRIPYDPVIRSDLRSVTKQTTAAGNIRFTAERTPDGHADRFWALALAKHAASNPSAPIEFQSTGPRLQTRLDGPGVVTTDVGFGTVPGSLNLRGF
jgi:phage FluMu gp28-like protein